MCAGNSYCLDFKCHCPPQFTEFEKECVNRSLNTILSNNTDLNYCTKNEECFDGFLCLKNQCEWASEKTCFNSNCVPIKLDNEERYKKTQLIKTTEIDQIFSTTAMFKNTSSNINPELSSLLKVYRSGGLNSPNFIGIKDLVNLRKREVLYNETCSSNDTCINNSKCIKDICICDYGYTFKVLFFN